MSLNSNSNQEASSSSGQSSNVSQDVDKGDVVLPAGRQSIKSGLLSNGSCSSQSMGGKAEKRDFAINGFNPTTHDIKLPILVGTRTLEYIKWSKTVINCLKGYGIHSFVLSDEQKSLDEVLDDDDGHHSNKAVLRMYNIVHSRLATALRIATSNVLGSVFFDDFEKAHSDSTRIIPEYDVPAPAADQNAYLLWNLIKNKLNRRTAGDKQFLYNKIQGLRYFMGQDPLELKRKFDELRHELTDMGFDGITEEASKTLWLNYIPKELESIRQGLECQSNHTTDDIYNALYANYVRNKNANRNKDESFKKHYPKPSSKPQQQINEVSDSAKQKPHYKKDSKFSKSNKFQKNSGDKRCTHCDKSGHTVDTCFRKEIHDLKKQLARASTGAPEELSYLQDSDEKVEYLCSVEEIKDSNYLHILQDPNSKFTVAHVEKQHSDNIVQVQTVHGDIVRISEQHLKQYPDKFKKISAKKKSKKIQNKFQNYVQQINLKQRSAKINQSRESSKIREKRRQLNVKKWIAQNQQNQPKSSWTPKIICNYIDLYLQKLQEINSIEDEDENSTSEELEEANATFGELIQKDLWLLDSGAQRNITPFRELLNDVKKLQQPITMVAANGARMQAKYSGALRLTPKRIVSEVLWLPSARRNLLSESRILEKKTPIYKDVDFCYFLRKSIKFEPEDYFLRIPRNKKTGMFEFTRKVNNNGEILDDISPQVHRAFKDVPSAAPSSSSSNQPIRRFPKRNQPNNRRAQALNVVEDDFKEFSESRNDSSDEEYGYILALSEMYEGELQALATVPQTAVDLYHRRLGHAGEKRMIQAVKTKLIPLTEREVYQYFKNGKPACCINGIITRKPVASIRDKAYVATRVLQCLWYDILGPMSVIDRSSKTKKKTRAVNGYLYLLVVVDEFSRAVFVFAMKRKSEAKNLLQTLVLSLQKRTGYGVERMRSDRAKEFLNSMMTSFCRQHGIYQAPTPAYSPALNGLVERMNRSIFDLARPMLLQAGADKRLWAEAAKWAAFLLNVTPNVHLDGKTPFQVLFNYHFDLKRARVFGCDAHVMNPPPHQTLIDEKTWDGVFVGYDFEQDLYKVMMQGGQIYPARDVEWSEQSFEQLKKMFKKVTFKLPKQRDTRQSPAQQEPHMPIVADENPYSNLINSSSDEDDSSDHDSSVTVADRSDTEAPQSPPPIAAVRIDRGPTIPRELRNLQRDAGQYEQWNRSWAASISQLPALTPEQQALSAEYTRDFKRRIQQAQEDSDAECLMTAIEDRSEPKTHKQAMAGPDREQWIKAEKAELDSLKMTQAYRECLLPSGKVALPSHMVYKIKRGPNGEILRYKVRLVAGGHRQVHGRDYDETFSPVAKMKSIKLLLSIAAQHDLVLKQIDFDTAFLNAPLKEEVYIRPPDGYGNINPKLIWKLERSLYGLKQAGRNWYIELDKAMKNLGYEPLAMDPCLYIRKTLKGNLMYTTVYVDDQITACNTEDVEEWESVRKSLAALFNMKQMPTCHWVLNMAVSRDEKTKEITLSQEQYTKDLLTTFGMAQAKPDRLPHASEPLQMTIADGKEGIPLSLADHNQYRSMIGGLLYLANLTRIDICYTVNRLAQFVHAPKAHHMCAAKRVLRYLAGTSKLGLVFKPNKDLDEKSQGFVVYSDADWAADVATRKSVSGGVVFYNGNLIHWFSKKQELTAQSTMEAEYIAMHACTKDIIWFQQWIQQITKVKPPTRLLCDNTSAIISSKADKSHQRTRHIDIRYHLVRDHVLNDHMKVEYVQTDKQIADCLTKPLSHEKFIYFRNLLLR